MSQEYLLVDGYNIINAWSALALFKEEDMEHAREKLIELLSSYQMYKGIKLILVFDAHLVKGGLESRTFNSPVEVVFTREGETADSFIERLVYELSEKCKLTVATSDWEEQRIVLGKGASRVSARELWDDLVNVQSEIRNIYSKHRGVYYHNSLIGRLDLEKQKLMESLRRKK